VIKKKKGYTKFAAKKNLVCKKLATNKKPGKKVVRVKNAYSCPSGYKR
jgi:hypothetical protein